MITIVNVVWLSEEGKEAEIHLSDGILNLICFSCPFDQNNENLHLNHLYTLNATAFVKLESEKNLYDVKCSETLDCVLRGKIINSEIGLVQLGEFFIELDNVLPGDLQVDDYVSFYCDRIDLY